MNPSLQFLEYCASETGFVVATLEKVVRLGELAGDIGRHPFLREVLVLKGGTALNLGYGAPTRLSVDLDFNYIGALERSAMLKDRPQVEQAVIELAQRAGYRVQQSSDAFAGRKIYLDYRSVSGPQDRIEVDLNFLFRTPFAPLVRRDLWQPGDLDRPSLLCVGDHELLAGKLLALVERCAARDAWDVVSLAPDLVECFELPTFRARFVAIAGILDHPLGSYSRERLEAQLTQREVNERLSPMLAQGKRVQAGELVAAAWQRLGPLLNLRPEETSYMNELAKGRLALEGLFDGDQEEIDRFAQHPAICWKVLNVRRHRKRDS
jgi:predicted nucleotidyltransferase component of viral defense system